MTLSNIAFLFLIFITLFLFFLRISYIIRLINIGQGTISLDHISKRLKFLFINGFGQRLVLRKISGIGHFLIFWGFIFLILDNIESLIRGIYRDFSFTFLGSFYGLINFFQDVFGVLVISAVLISVYRRLLIRPMRLEGSLRHKVSAFIIISFIAIIIISFYAKSIIKPKIGWTPVTNILRELILDHKQQPGEYEVTYLIVQWIHNGVVLGFLMYLLYSKHSHIIFAFPNLFFKNEKPFGLIEKVDLRSENINCFGVQHISDFKKKDLIELFACTECGWCQESCPAYTTGNPLSPKKVILNLKDHLLKEGPDMLKNLKQKSHTALNNIIKEEVLWSCTTCGACEEACPVGIMPMSKIIEMRQACILMEGKFPEAVQIALRNIETQSNPWGLPQELRGRWAQDLGVKTLSENADVEYLFYVGCAGSYDERYISASKALVKLLQKAGIQFGILGNEEMCTGDSAKRIGNDYLAQELANANISIFNHYGVKKIITTCPHCFNTIKNEYHQHDGHYEVIHSTTLLSSLIKNGKINLKNHSAEENKRITYHDSCYLGRYNNIMDEPRDIIKNIRKYELVELKRNLKNSFCCGAGGGRMWMADKDGTSINFARSREVLESNVKMVATACPFCKTMISDGMKKENKDKEIQILDIAEIVAEELA